MDELEDYIHYNVKVFKPLGADFEQAIYSENRIVPILKNPKDYEFAVERFRIPLQAIPIFIWVPNKFSVKLVYLGVEYDAVVPYIPSQVAGGWYGDAVWNYQDFVDMVNQALNDAFTALKTAVPGAPVTESPYITYEPDSQLVKFNAEQTYASAPVDIYFNSELLYMFNCFPSFADTFGGLEYYKIIVKDFKNNSATIGGKAYYSTYGEYNVLPLWSDLASISLNSDQIPVLAENLSSQRNVIRTVLTDFEPGTGINDKQGLQYFPQGPLRFYSLLGTTELRSIDVRLFWTDKQGKDYPFYIGDNEYFTVKLLFRKIK